MTEDPSRLYKLCWSERNRQVVLALGKKAADLGMKDQFLAALQYLINKLTTEPLWGDPNYELPAARVLMCHGIYSLLHVYYGVDVQRRIVYIKEIEPVPAFGLEGNE